MHRTGTIAVCVCGLIIVGLYVHHALWAGFTAYSKPAVLVTAKAANGSRIVYDDFREAYVPTLRVPCLSSQRHPPCHMSGRYADSDSMGSKLVWFSRVHALTLCVRDNVG